MEPGLRACEVHLAADGRHPAMDTCDFAQADRMHVRWIRRISRELRWHEDAGPPVIFSYRVESLPLTLFYSDRATTPGMVRFALGETKRFVVDIQASAFVEGEYESQGSFADVDAVKPLSLIVRP